ncbi:MAG: deoxynucleoside kinase [Thermodesulfobacteriota bacterium]
MIIAIEGNIGAGKTELIKKLCVAMPNCVPYYEPVNNNPYLALFYEDPKRWAFPNQMGLLLQRTKTEKRAYELSTVGLGKICLLDRSLIGDYIFAKVNHDRGNISQLELQTYNQYFRFVNPGMFYRRIIFLDVTPETAKYRLEQRKSWQEKEEIPLSYYQALDTTYREHLKNFPNVQYIDWEEPYQSVTPIIEMLQQ